MHLSTTEKTRFYSTMTSVLHYVNQHKSVVKAFPAQWDETSPPNIQDVAEIRTELWQDNGLIDAFVAENPAKLTQSDLALVASWKHYVSGHFYIFRHLKNYTVFLDDDVAYAVTGISESLEDMIGGNLPIYVDTVLIPFEDRIIYDGIFMPYPIFFGSGIKASLKDSYRHIQERQGITTELGVEIDDETLRNKVQASNKKVLRAFEKHMGQSGLSAKKMLEHNENLALFAEDFLLKHNPPTYLLDIIPTDIEAYLQTKTKKVNLISLKRFVRFLRDTYRIDYEIAEDTLTFLKHKK